MDKTTFRTQQLQRLGEASAATQEEGPELIAKLLRTPQWQAAQSIATTISGGIEVPTGELIRAAHAAGKRVYLPKVMPHRQMAFLPDPGAAGLIKSKFGLLEPPFEEQKVAKHLDLIIVPGIGFALDSHARIGFGGGYYDRFLAQYQGETLTLVPSAMSFASAEWPIEAHDQRIDHLITLS